MTDPTPERSKGKSILKVLLGIGGWVLFLIGFVVAVGTSMDLTATEPEESLVFNGIALTVGLILCAIGLPAMIKLTSKWLLCIGAWFLFLIGVVAAAGTSADLVAREPEETLVFNGIWLIVGLIFGALGFRAMSKLEVNKGLLKWISALTGIGGLSIMTAAVWEFVTREFTVSPPEDVVFLVTGGVLVVVARFLFRYATREEAEADGPKGDKRRIFMPM